ncbi:hypothetical protein KL918_003886 [Ogataea parapolymorpha]|uniref:Uncharacterized protein n=1 Tax=Ogataea parapolymorpha (strain ATCC 26012 / BCRC 20466 / JCM 22074 / NRRL Y-7560 / DL-1) TaxID=871575 RepID=W1QCV4_OGAPD|nr:hypothetical protein HPODL_03997 [Ogataea parapolymorpha DL-1]ESW98369.1 hypothetical protein HPODL_03997 [Ogataea parapolymorpha DL-1]KAG7865898.1 hypothetical protein KL918_003886 [Ogataea parapolymorpha]KAG7874949.1 hypothetical protein KL916_001194 [Ogataea parapolymorpha]KAG7876296.1 hypothetical protein KL938_004687 [Ogataea parapolymorpha]
MGLCGSKEAPKRPGNPAFPQNQVEAKVAKHKGQRLGSATENEANGLSAKELAAKAAKDRYEQERKKNEKGELGKKLAQEIKKSSKDHAMEKYHNKNKEELVYD